MSLFKDALTEADGVSYALVKVIGMAFAVVFLGLAIASFVTGRAFDMVGYGTASGLVIAALGVAIRMAEPKPPEQK